MSLDRFSIVLVRGIVASEGIVCSAGIRDARLYGVDLGLIDGLCLSKGVM